MVETATSCNNGERTMDVNAWATANLACLSILFLGDEAAMLEANDSLLEFSNKV